jgi:hypothetical protein
MNNIKLETKISRVSNHIASELDNEVVMMSIEQGEYYGFGQVGSELWRLIEQPKSVLNIIELFIGQYNVDFEQCQRDVVMFLEQLELKGLIKITV